MIWRKPSIVSSLMADEPISSILSPLMPLVGLQASVAMLDNQRTQAPAKGPKKIILPKSAMASSSKKRARIISAIASRIYFLVIILQVPLFRFPCRIGMCKTPIEVALSHMIASEVFPDVAVKAFLYPGAIAKAIISNTEIPSYNDLLNFFEFSYLKGASAATDLKHLEVLVGSYLCVAGAFLGLIKPGRASLFGVLLVLWGIARELVLQKHVATKDLRKAVSIYTTMWIPVLSAFFSVRGDVRKLIRSCKAKRIAKQLRMYSKAKFK